MTYLIAGAAGFMGSNYVRHLRGRDSEANIVVLDALTYAGNLQNLAGLIPPANLLVPDVHQELAVVSHDIQGRNGPVPSYAGVLERWSKKMSGLPSVAVENASLREAVRSRIGGRGAVVFVLGSTTDSALVEALMPLVDYVVNFAAETHVDRSINDPGVFLRSDVVGVQTLLEAARNCSSLRRFIQISTDEVYGSVEEGSCTETDLLSPTSPYAASKAAADHFSGAYARTFAVPVIILRPTNNFGPFQYPEKLIPLMIVRALADKPLPVYGDGLQQRTWLHVEDTARAIDLLLGAAGPEEVYNLAGEREMRNIDLVGRIIERLGKSRSLIRHVADRPGHDRRYSVNDERIRSLGFVHGGGFDRYLDATIDWYRQNPGWWLPTLADAADYGAFMDAWYAERR